MGASAIMRTPQSSHWARTTTPKRSFMHSRYFAVLAVAALVATVAASAGMRSTGRSTGGGGGGSARSLLHKFSHSSSSHAVSVPAAGIDDSIVFGVFTHIKRIRQVQAGRGWRKGHRTVVAVDMEEFPDWLQEDATLNRETWIYYQDFNHSLHQGDRRGAMLPLLVLRELGDTFKWMLYGDDDTMWLRPNPDILVRDYDADKPHVLTGGGKTTRTAQGFTAVFACDTPCTPQLLCDHLTGYGEYWGHWFSSNLPLNCSDPNNSGAYWEMPVYNVHALHGGGGAIFSVGALRHMNESGTVFEDCTEAGPWHLNSGSDAILTRCMWKVGLSITDPGFSALPPGVDPATFPDSPQNISDPYILWTVDRRRLFGGAGYSNWKDIRALLAGLPPKSHDPNISSCSGGSLCDRESQADYLRRAVSTHVAARDITDPEIHIPFMKEFWGRFEAWRSNPTDTRPSQKAAEILTVQWR